MRSWIFAIALFLATGALAQQASPLFRGSWTATAGRSQVLRGSWSGQALARRPNAARGSWTLLTETGQILLEGTWSAQKTRLGWEGTWAARIRHGRAFSGTWKADIAELRGKTFQDMLKWTAEKEVAGSWRSGRYQGNWWLNAPRSHHRRR